jgi:hypothetical protein
LAEDLARRCQALMIRPVGSGKTALLLALCRALREEYNIGKPRCSCLAQLNPPFPLSLALSLRPSNSRSDLQYLGAATAENINRLTNSNGNERHFHSRRPRIPNPKRSTPSRAYPSYRNGWLSPRCYSGRYICESTRFGRIASCFRN